MRIDIHSHFIPRSVVRAADLGKPWHGVVMSRTASGALRGFADGKAFGLPDWTADLETTEERIARMDRMGIDIEVLSIAPRLQRYGAEAESSVAVARDMNDDLVAITEAEPQRFRGFVHLPLQDIEASLAELERMSHFPGIIGAAVGSNVNGRPWDSPELFPVLEAVQKLNVMLFVHPANRPADERMRRFHLKNLVGNPLETTLAIAALIFSGTLDRLPTIKLCFAHAGGFAAMGIGRFDYGYNARQDVRDVAAALPSEYLKRLYFDSLTFSERSLRHVVDVTGVSQVFLGSDYPADMGTDDPVGHIQNMSSFTELEKQAILGGNLEAMLDPVK